MSVSGYSRRTVAAVLAASVAVGRLARATGAQEPDPPKFGDGVAGGGTFESSAGLADFSLVAFAQDTVAGGADYIGTFSLQDSNDPENPLVMTTEWLSGYSAPDEDLPDFRQVVGWGMANDSGPFPFVLEVEPGGDGESGAETLVVLFGDTAAILLGGDSGSACDCGGFDYRVKGTVVHGGVTLFDTSAASG